MTKTVPFSARISVEDAEFISQLEYEGAHTPSDKFRALLAETRLRHVNRDDYGYNLARMQERMGNIKCRLLVRQEQLNIRVETLIGVLDALPDLLASLETLSARSPQLNRKELQLAEQQILQKLAMIYERVLPLALTRTDNATSQQEGLFMLAQLINDYRMTHKGEEG